MPGIVLYPLLQVTRFKKEFGILICVKNWRKSGNHGNRLFSYFLFEIRILIALVSLLKRRLPLPGKHFIVTVLMPYGLYDLEIAHNLVYLKLHDLEVFLNLHFVRRPTSPGLSKHQIHVFGSLKIFVISFCWSVGFRNKSLLFFFAAR